MASAAFKDVSALLLGPDRILEKGRIMGSAFALRLTFHFESALAGIMRTPNQPLQTDPPPPFRFARLRLLNGKPVSPKKDNMREALIKLVTNHTPFDDVEREHTMSTLEFLHKNKNCTSTDNLKGHITASAWVLSPHRTETLLTHHRKLNRWLQLGGHIEDDATVQGAALREAVEESGIENIHLIEGSIFDIDVHLIPARKEVAEHCHYDIRFLFQTERKDFVISHESNELAWVKLTDIGNFVSDESVLRLCRKSKAYSGAQ